MPGTATRKLTERLQPEERGTSRSLKTFVWSTRGSSKKVVSIASRRFSRVVSRRGDDNDLCATVIADFVVGGFSRRSGVTVVCGYSAAGSDFHTTYGGQTA